MKKIIALFLIVVLLFSFAACKKDSDDGDVTEELTETTSEQTEETKEETLTEGEGSTEPEIEKNAFNPLTGLSDMASDNIGRRPVAVAVNNFRYSRWQSGISNADIIFEAESVSGQTQLVCLFSDIRNIGVIGAVDYAYNTLSQVVTGLDSAFVHDGYPPNYPNNFIEKNKVETLNGKEIDDLLYVDDKRHEEYILEYSIYTDSGRIENAMEQTGLLNSASEAVPAFHFVPEGQPSVVPSEGKAKKVSVIFTNIYDVDLRYDAKTGQYRKFQFLFEHTDKEASKKQLLFENAFVLFAPFQIIEDTAGVQNRLIEADYSKGGHGYYFTGGAYEKISWKINSSTGFFDFANSKGQPLEVNKGKTYISVVDEINEYTMKIVEE